MKRHHEYKKGKGVSPLIATTLLVGFTVALVALTALWSRGYLEERAAKEEKLASAKLNCQNIKFSVSEDSMQSGSLIDIYMENKGTMKIDGFIFRITGDSNTQSVEWKQPVGGLESKHIQLGPNEFSAEDIGNVNTIGIIPLLKVASNVYVPCSGQLMEIRA